MRPETEIARRTRRSFLVGGIAAVAGIAAFELFKNSSTEDGTPGPLRRILQTNEKLARAYFSPSRLAPEFSEAKARMPKANGDIGLEDEVDAAEWKFQSGGRSFSLDEVKTLPRIEQVTELKCIEGWSQVVHWTGARFSDFATRFGIDNGAAYVAMATPDEKYFVGLDRESAMHPQTLLCYEMNGAPITDEHGAPLRLVIPVKYGIKNIKRIGSIKFSSSRPDDYWAKEGYDWYAGL
jgi:DMSO/TMAO reductase YedYZ molybdopterin-dependent catalytic subunit